MQVYFDCFSGISGDMTLGALVDLGVPVDYLNKEISKLPLSGFHITTEPVKRHGISAKNLFVKVEDEKTARDYADIKKLISESPLSEKVKTLSLEIFRRIAEAEAKIHDCDLDHVHFHEVGAIDAIVDIVGTALCVEYLGVEKVYASKIPTGGGFVKCSHGVLPVPAPATLEILKGVPVYDNGVEMELVTPTGAAIVTTLAESFGPVPDMSIEKTGYGSGKREGEKIPNLLRVITGKGESKSADDVIIVETCIDDMNPEIFGYLMEQLLEDGALDVYWMPVFMKKNRPGTKVQVVCMDSLREIVTDRILHETTSIGVRYFSCERSVLERSVVTINSVFGEIKVKKIINTDGSSRLVPEYEECREIALENGLSLRAVYEEVYRAAGNCPEK